ncbi:hypothetical protein [Fontimonas sp. SYSU GA230001]|uniref:hypothetical protein n=1 Tax=Fontimonas sp. SYSU GA230001 TaxID=3142450 RepID=UPI0032B5023C
MKKSLIAGALGSLVFLSACSSGRSDEANSVTQRGDGRVSAQSVSGPLDPVQGQLSDGVFIPLAAALSGTPLEGVVLCADQLVANDVLDIADGVLAQLQAAASGGGAQPDPAAVAASLQSLVVDLTGLLSALGGTGDGCLTRSLTLAQISAGGNPLAGTPLEPLGTALAPVLAQVAGALDATEGSGEDLQLTTVAALYSQINTALQSGLSQIPAPARSAPVVGGILTTLSTAFTDTNRLLGATLAYNASGTQMELGNTLYNTLVNVTTQVVPVAFIEQQAGQPGLISSQLRAAAAQFSAALASALGQVTTPVLSDVLAGAAEPVLDPIENQVLPAILGPIIDALASGGVGSGGSPLSGTPLDAVVGTLITTLTGLLGGGGLGGLPLGGSCPLASVPLLSVLCGLTGG